MRVDDFVLDIESRQLHQGGAERHLSPKAFELLRLLIEQLPRALSKAELHKRLWPSTFVSDATLSSLIAEVRAALGETAGRARLVRTVHRFGYAFGGTLIEPPSSTGPPRERTRCWVVWEWGQVALVDGDHLLGRDGDVAVWLESPTVSRHHARIRVAGGVATIEDLGSKNGTFVAGARVTAPSPLNDGDEIRLGSVLTRYRQVLSGASTETHEGRRV